MITLFNTLTRSKETFIPLDEKLVKLYSCGPTVYHYVHLGNLRSYVFADTLKRTLISAGYDVIHVTNVTDIGHLVSDGDDGEDKMTKALKREGLALDLMSMRKVANHYFEEFQGDMKLLNIIPATFYPFASDNVNEDITLVKTLLAKNHAYRTSDGVYFDTETFPNYGELAKHLSTSEEHSRTGVNTEKKNSRDFALWKFNEDLGYEASFGKGFPGWHIECSAMSMKYLGNHFDIHTGGIDHIPIHHTNEIAQSEAATGTTYVNYWMHNNFLNDTSGKMSKSNGDFLRLQTLLDEKIDPLAFRYYLLLTHYRSEIQFSFDALRAAEVAYKKMKAFVGDTQDNGSLPHKDTLNAFCEALYDDLGAPKAIGLLWTMMKDTSLSSPVKRATLLTADAVLGLNLDAKHDIVIPDEIYTLAEKRKDAKSRKDFAEADRLRLELEALGYSIQDTSEGYTLQ